MALLLHDGISLDIQSVCKSEMFQSTKCYAKSTDWMIVGIKLLQND